MIHSSKVIAFPGFNSSSESTMILRKENFSEERNTKKQVGYNSPLANKNEFSLVLADDDADDRDLFEEAVRKLPTELTLKTVINGADLLKLLYSSERIPDFIFLDLNMPIKNGRECLEEIRSSQKLKHLIVIVYSTSSSTNDIEDTFQMGANLYVCKPSSFKGIVEMISKIINMDWDNYKPKSCRKKYILTI
mgnify:CR=1 FL=1